MTMMTGNGICFTVFFPFYFNCATSISERRRHLNRNLYLHFIRGSLKESTLTK